MKAKQIGNNLILTWEKSDEIKMGETITVTLPSMEVIKTEILVDENWIPAVPETYYSSLFERITHLFGKHWFYECDHCLLCGKVRNIPK